MAHFTRDGSARWQGGLKDGKGTVSTQSGALSEQPYGFDNRFDDKPGTNPEELVGAAHAACFSMALSKMLEEAGITGISIQTTSKITLEQDGEGFSVTKAHLETRISGDGDKARIEELAQQAKAGCPISKLLNAEISLDATVA
ncbi:OsmC family protein [Paracoccus salsus]|uniref:OsmC family protein n=1 Tax=Paracoccus salsus TaxID=2911061 RepID=UPI001F439B81|nr:OsmC family protein [Paracoccus salsus]MCF3972944.1 OsmC family protein [Paracoccus salsus]